MQITTDERLQLETGHHRFGSLFATVAARAGVRQDAQSGQGDRSGAPPQPANCGQSATLSA